MTSRPHVIGTLSGLPHYAFGHRNPVWWGTLAFILIEGIGFVLAGGSYLYLMGQEPSGWPPAGVLPPALLWGTLFTVLILLSGLPNLLVDIVSHKLDLNRTRAYLVVMSVIGALLLLIRAFEFAHLNVRWDGNAYGSIVWALMFLHTLHLLTDWLDTLVLTAFMFTHDVDAERFTDVSDNAFYWWFVLISWLPIYALVYWAPRLIP